MKKQITRISPFQSAKVFALLYFIISIPFVAVAAASFYYMAPQTADFPIARALVMPFIYAAIGFVFTIIGAMVYNWVAKLVGGIEFTTSDSQEN